MEILFKGIDVSKWQGAIDWKKVKQAGIQFAMLRDGFGRYEGQADEYFEQNYKAATEAGIHVGAYHFSYAKTVEQARAEAAYCKKLIAGKTFSFPIAYDVEDSAQASLSKAEVSAIVDAFCSEMEAAGYYVCVYMNLSWLNSKLTDDIFKKYDIWLGISGRVDLDYAYKNYPNIMRQNGLNGYPRESDPASGGAAAGAAFPARRMVTLENTPLYVSSTAKTPAARKTGTFYIYDGIKRSGRYRITNAVDRCGKKPVSENVTGYVDESDLR